MNDVAKPSSPLPLPYHRALVEYFQAEEPGLWQWFASTRKRTEEADAVRLHLLKTTYRVEPVSQPRLYEIANEVRECLKLNCTVTLYQEQAGNGSNAAVAYLPGEAHVIFAGPLTTVLSEKEVKTVLAHELGHFLLWEQSAGQFLVAGDLVRSLSTDPKAGPAAMESARLYSLWTEIFADRWAYHVSQDVTVTIVALIKLATGLKDVSAEGYLRQADEIFAKSDAPSDHFSHPELYIRARALKLWAEQGDGAHAEIARMIESGLNLHRLDLLGQMRTAHLTRRFLQALLKPAWFHTEAVMAHARRFFPGFEIAPNPDEDALKVELEKGDASLRDYFCYVMLDFVTADRDLGDVALSAAIVLARRLGIDKRFGELAQKELTLGKKAFTKIDKDAQSILAKTESAATSSV